MTKHIVRAVKTTRCGTRPHNVWWTVGGALLVLNNLIHWKHQTRHTSYLARKHPLITVCTLAAYGYHFLGPVKKEA